MRWCAVCGRRFHLSKHRLLILLLGPLPIVALSLGLARWLRHGDVARAEGNHVVHSPAEPRAGQRLARARVTALRPVLVEQGSQLAAQCAAVAANLRGRLAEQCQVVERPPFVLAGDLSAEELDRWHQATIGPAARAMLRSYFRVAPDEPITVLLFANEHSYDQYARELYGDANISIYGYYKRGQRVLVMNAATGGGTIVHELTHALADADCPHIPDWLNEGLASLHEQCRIRADESALEGLENWRLPVLQQAIRQQRLRPLKSLIADDDFRLHEVGLNYAQARYFCLWLQRQGLLEEFFARWRTGQASDPLGIEAVAQMFPGKSWDQLDREFHAWALSLAWTSPKQTAQAD